MGGPGVASGGPGGSSGGMMGGSAYRQTGYALAGLNPQQQPQMPQGAPQGQSSEQQIFALLERRDECRRRKDYEGADRLKDELLNTHNVVVNDRERSWAIRTPASNELPGAPRFPGGAPPPPNANFSPPGVAAGQFRGAMPPGQQQQAPPMRVSHDYKRTATDRHPVDISRVDGLISARMNAKITRDFDKADALRMELRQLGVEVHDRDKMWFVDRPELAITTLGHATADRPRCHTWQHTTTAHNRRHTLHRAPRTTRRRKPARRHTIITGTQTIGSTCQTSRRCTRFWPSA